MNHVPSGMRHPIFLFLTVLGTFGCHSAGISQSGGMPAAQQAPVERFDLVVYGFDFDPGEHEVFLRTNLDFGSEWVSLGTMDGRVATGGADSGWGTAVFSDLSSERFLGQDFRESYIEVRISTRGGADGSTVSAFYAMPHTPGSREDAPRIARLIETDPLAVERHSVASHVQPTPHPLEPGVEYVQHVRAPMKHTLPGVAEVKQLQVEWRNRGG